MTLSKKSRRTVRAAAYVKEAPGFCAAIVLPAGKETQEFPKDSAESMVGFLFKSGEISWQESLYLSEALARRFSEKEYLKFLSSLTANPFKKEEEDRDMDPERESPPQRQAYLM